MYAGITAITELAVEGLTVEKPPSPLLPRARARVCVHVSDVSNHSLLEFSPLTLLPSA